MPDIAPQSTTSFVIVIGGSVIAHLAASALFALQDLACARSGMCWPIAFDPNVYKAIISHDAAFAASDGAIFLALLGIVLLGLLAALVAIGIGRNDGVQAFFRPSNATWLREIARAASDDDLIVLAYVMCKAGHDGAFAAYEGIVESLSPGPSGQVSSITLSSVDRFAVQVSKRGVERRGETAEADPISFLQIDQSEFSNIGFEIIEINPDG